ncbi:RNA-guided pseudouridylation complex pseudouridine synthase subunit Cbf5 [Candidatus Parvarchaeota archaeon]|nr:RNA-guided pseudouridylation complex pseudouridine synthase subunit Cbf5 [Candidatus Parvarchaeota archaeon]
MNRATRAISPLLLGGKEYVALMHLHGEVTEQLLVSVLDSFTGKIKQLPPVRSHVKRQEREREIFYIDLLEIQGKDVLFRVGVQSGTYIRKLIHDIGQKLGAGAHMTELRRTKVSHLSEKDRLVTLQDLEDAVYLYLQESDGRLLDFSIQTIEKALDFLPKVMVSDTAVDPICLGAGVAIPGIVRLDDFKAGDRIFISTLKGELIALGDAVLDSDKLIKMKKGIAVKTDSVIMLPGTYPRYKRKDIGSQ